MTVIFLPIINTVLQSSASMVRFMVTQLSAKQKISCLGQGLKERKTKNSYVCTKNPGEQPELYRQLGLSEPQQPGRTTARCAAPEGTHQPAKCMKELLLSPCTWRTLKISQEPVNNRTDWVGFCLTVSTTVTKNNL